MKRLRLLALPMAVLLTAASILPDVTGPDAQSPPTNATMNQLRRAINQNFLLNDGGNASLPTARNTLLYTPAVCDGQKNTDGSIAAGSDTLTMPSAVAVSGGLLAAYIGEPVTVEKAGANYFAIGATLVSGGTGNAVDDVLTFPGNVKIRVRQVDGSGTIVNDVFGKPGWQFVDVGESTTAPSGTQSQTASTGAGTGNQLTLTWQHVNLVTTIAEVLSDTSVKLALPNASGSTLSSIGWGFATDKSGALGAQLAMPVANGGDRRVQLPGGYCGLASTLTYQNNNKITGNGRGTNRLSASAFMWVGAHRGTMVSDGEPAAAVAAVFEDIAFYGMGAAGEALHTHGDSGSRFVNLSMLDCLNVHWSIDASALSGGGVRIPFFGVTIIGTTITMNRSASQQARGMVIGPGTGPLGSDTNRTSIINTTITNLDNTALEIGASDSSSISVFFAQSGSANPGWSIEMKCTVNANLGKATGWMMWQVQPIDGTVVRNTGCVEPPVANVMFLSRENGAAFPSIEAGAELLCTTTKGINCGTAPSGSWVATSTNTVTQNSLQPCISSGVGAGSRTIPGGTLRVGSQIDMVCEGTYSTPNPNTDTLTVTARLDSTAGSLIVLATNTPPVMPAGVAAKFLRIRATCTVRDLAPTANNVYCTGVAEYGNAAANGAVNHVTLDAGSTTIDTTIDQNLNLMMRWSNVVAGLSASFYTGTYRWWTGGQGGLW